MRFASGKQVNLAFGELKVSNALNQYWCETSLLPQAILKHAVSRDFIVKTWYICDQYCWSYSDCLVGQQA